MFECCEDCLFKKDSKSVFGLRERNRKKRKKNTDFNE
jgi:hypothetical protein